MSPRVVFILASFGSWSFFFFASGALPNGMAHAARTPSHILGFFVFFFSPVATVVTRAVTAYETKREGNGKEVGIIFFFFLPRGGPWLVTGDCEVGFQ